MLRWRRSPTFPAFASATITSLPWLWTTILLGAAFLAGQVYAWRLLRAMNPTFATNTSISLFFIVTGVHAVHLLGGLIALLYAGVTSLAAQAPGDAPHHPRCDGVVLALHGRYCGCTSSGCCISRDRASSPEPTDEDFIRAQLRICFRRFASTCSRSGLTFIPGMTQR